MNTHNKRNIQEFPPIPPKQEIMTFRNRNEVNKPFLIRAPKIILKQHIINNFSILSQNFCRHHFDVDFLFSPEERLNIVCKLSRQFALLSEDRV